MILLAVAIAFAQEPSVPALRMTLGGPTIQSTSDPCNFNTPDPFVFVPPECHNDPCVIAAAAAFTASVAEAEAACPGCLTKANTRYNQCVMNAAPGGLGYLWQQPTDICHSNWVLDRQLCTWTAGNLIIEALIELQAQIEACCPPE